MLSSTPRAVGAGSRRRSHSLTGLMTVCVALGAALLMPTAAGAAGSTNKDAFNNLGQADRNEWMHGISSSTKLSQMSIPGTHDTLSIHGGENVQTQEDHGDSANTLTAQLNAGIRAIDIRVRRVNNTFTIHHASFYQKANFADVLDKAQDFLKANPKETIVMRLRAECPYKNAGTFECANSPTASEDEVRSTFQKYVAAPEYGGLFYAPSVSGSSQADIPKLGDVRGKIVLGSFDNAGKEGDEKYGIKGFNAHKEDTYAAPTIPAKWNFVKDNVDKAMPKGSSSDDLYLTYSSASNAPFSLVPSAYAGGYRTVDNDPNTYVEGINYRLMKHLNNTQGRVGIVMMDFPGWGLVNAIIDHNADNTVSGGNRMIWMVNKDKTYVNSLNGRCMVRGPEFDDSKSGGLVTQRECQSSPPSSHQWEAQKPSSFDNKGYFWIKASNGKCLTVPYNNGNPPGSGTQLFWWDCETRWFSGSQMWNVVPTKVATATGSKDGFKFINNWTGMCLSMDPATADKSGGKVTQETCPKK
ncbi:phosphatidylinositol-specific phospholipase C domain-containing protein [Streptomyces sp. NPDC015345]|uniref:phosphatidylinositol-specific phospholipase C domain-containing protein n=1 Tax=Streptomyces sp. NPDC015345 TaxID=3364953 RepID=UPI0036FE8037